MHNVQQLSLADKAARMEMCLRFQEKMNNDDNWINNICISDEAHLHLNENVNSQNCRTMSSEPPDEVNKRSLHSAKCTAWCAISAHGIIGSLCFEEYDTIITITQELYLLLCFVAKSARSAFWIAVVSAGRCNTSYGEWDHEGAWRDDQ